MCGRIVYVWDPLTKQLVQKLVDDVDFPEGVQHVLQKQRYNVPPASHLPVIARDGDHTTVTVARWGFPIAKRPNGVFNTRIETAFESPMWRGLIGSRNCLFPVKGFYEWSQDKRHAPHFVSRADGQPMLLGGIMGERTWDGESLRCASIVTCGPNELLQNVHDRMPVIIEESDAKTWLHGGAEATLELAGPAGDVLQMHEVGAVVGNAANDGPELIEPKARGNLDAFAD